MAVLHCHCMGYYSNPLCHHEGESAVSPFPASLRVSAEHMSLSPNAATVILCQRQKSHMDSKWPCQFLGNACY